MSKRTTKSTKPTKSAKQDTPVLGVTESQQEVLNRIFNYTGRVFTGTTRQEAQSFIKESMKLAATGESEKVTEAQRRILMRIKNSLGIDLQCNCRTCAADFINKHLTGVVSNPTNAQLMCIKRIEGNIDVKFEGSTFDEAKAFISTNLPASLKAERDAKCNGEIGGSTQ